jgi:hypothetical protein
MIGAPMIFMGYGPGSAAYRCYDPNTKSVHISRDVIFDEEVVWDWTADQAADMSFGFTVADEAEYSPTTSFRSDHVDDSAPVVIDDVVQSVGGVPHTVPQGRSPCPPTQIHEAPQQVEAATPKVVEELQSEISFSDNLDAAHDADAPLRIGKITDIHGSASPPGRATRNVHRELFFAAGEEPTSFQEAEQEVAWRNAMTDEINSIEENNTWKLTDLPVGYRPIGLTWVYKLKKDASGVIVKHKARLVAKGYVQQAGVDFDEVYALVARLDSVRLLLTLATQENWMVHHMEMKFSFLYRDLREEVCVVQPPGFVNRGKNTKCISSVRPCMV